MQKKIKKFIKIAIYIFLAAIFIYYGTCCIFTLINANTQCYLMSETAQYNFMGYYILAALYAGICIADIVVCLILRAFKNFLNV